MAVMTPTTALIRIKKALKEAKKEFPLYRLNVIRSVSLSTEINGYIEERNNQNSTEHEEQVQWKIDTMRREFSIYLSRVNYLDDLLYTCGCMISKLGHSLRHAKDEETKKRKLKDCVDFYLSWHNLRREFHAALRKAETQWTVEQEKMLALLA